MSQVKPRVLLVDDVEANLVALRALLADMDCELVSVGSGNEALKHLLQNSFAVMLLDVQMPGMDGYEVAKYARDNPQTREVPIIFLTAMHSSEDNVLRGYGSGAVDFLLKPINPRVLRGKVRVFLDLHLGRRRLADEVAAHEKTLAELRVANAALRHFTNAASHDLREPLRAVCGFLDVLAEEVGAGLEARPRDYLDRSRRAAGRMVSLLDSLLVYARLQSPAAWQEVDCSVLLDQVRTDLAARLTGAHAELAVAALPRVRGDASRLYQLFLNLVSNAIKFRRPGVSPHVTVSADGRDDEAVFCVQDNGIGIDGKNQQIVFDAFRRVHDRSQYEGSGLGLTICQQIVEQHGGRIWLESETGVGSRFYFALPRAGAGAPAARSDPGGLPL